MEKRFKSNPLLKERYHEYMKNLIKSQHIELVPVNRMSLPPAEIFYLPHHAVLKESSLTTKLRVVFNASRKSTSGISLNDKLLIGPTVQEDLFSILVRWRLHFIVFIADIEKMFRQIKIIEEHRDYQRLLWRFSTDGPILEFRVTTVIDGTASATFLATRALLQASEDGALQYPQASKVVKQDFYMDDVSSGSHSVETAIQLQQNLIELLKDKGFLLRKWFSNAKELMESVPKENRHDPEALVELIDTSIKTLGVYWNQKQDCFEFKVATFKVKKLTKREVLSDIAKLFDPIRWLSPTTIMAKIFMQTLWSIKKLGWDHKLPDEKQIEWETYRQQLSTLEQIKIPRWIGTTEIVNIELHGFADAANLAYAAVVYSKVILSDNSVKVSVISGKTKVAPLKTISTAKLELCGCVLLSNLITKIKTSFHINTIDMHMYSDSTIALAWITSHPNHWNTFVANRVTDIQQLTDVKSWHFVNTEQNPADCASRGVLPSNLKDHQLWWNGPSFLSKRENNWNNETFETDLERRKVIRTMHSKNQWEEGHMDKVLKKQSDIFKLQRITAYALRWLQKNKPLRNAIPNATENVTSLKAWIKFAQRQAFGAEIDDCINGDELPSKSKLISLRPFVDIDGILRVGGRLRKSNLPSELKNPIILPKKHHLTKLIIEQAHKSTLHGGPSLMSVFLKNYWIFGKSEQINRVVSKCVTCFPYRCKPQQQIMADLPRDRVIQHRAFLHSGVDYAGPVYTKNFIGRTRGRYAIQSLKSYIAIFVCFSTKAVHLQLVSNQTSVAFIEAYKRFTALCGKVSDLYSDCGTNFIGADRMLREQLEQTMSDPLVQNHLAKDGTNWHFNPPATPHFGGLWEASVKSVKYHLKRLCGDNQFTFEEMSTILYQIQACLNSRPLCAMNEDLYDNEYLTPGHFVIGEAPITVPQPNLLNTNSNRLSRWQLAQKVYQQFWKHWSTDYLSKLQQRTKWMKSHDNVRVGQLVLYREDNLPPTKWPLARILEIHPGDDNNTRAVTLRTPTTILKRPINKISVLPIDQ